MTICAAKGSYGSLRYYFRFHYRKKMHGMGSYSMGSGQRCGRRRLSTVSSLRGGHDHVSTPRSLLLETSSAIPSAAVMVVIPQRFISTSTLYISAEPIVSTQICVAHYTVKEVMAIGALEQ